MGDVVQITPYGRASKPFTITSGQSQSVAVDVEGFDPIALHLPSVWTTANITFLAAEKFDGTYLPVFGPTGTEAMATMGTQQRVILLSEASLADLRGLRYLKLRSGTLASPVAQTGDRVIQMLVRQGA